MSSVWLTCVALHKALTQSHRYTGTCTIL
uniref:Uncharacterized protein n=1 Tax=Anguilla anguilla TaxID=7936 RepID=A0A0E9UYA9_ANGAN